MTISLSLRCGFSQISTLSLSFKGLVGFLLLGFVCVGRRLHCCGLVFGEKICGFWEDKMVVVSARVYVFVDFFFLYLVVLCLLS